MKRLLIMLSLVLLSAFVFAQNDKFSSQSDAFIQDLGKFIRDSKSEPAEVELELFEVFWASGDLTDQNQKLLVTINLGKKFDV